MILATIGVVATTTSGCAHSVPVSGAPSAAAEVSAAVPAGMEPKWSAVIRAVTQARFNAPDSTRNTNYGSIQWTHADIPSRSNVNLVYNYSGAERDLSWAILFGNCGSATLPLMPMSNFPELEVTAGQANFNSVLSLEMPVSGEYHVEIYKDRRGGEESVVGCGNLKRTR
jgi:hypothetical protein